jgi:plastocyanin
MSSTVTVPAPIAGVIVTREANIGQNVDQSTTMFTVVDLSTVWVVGDVYERDFGKVRVGTPATVSTEAFSGLAMSGNVSYVDPKIDQATRTAKVRVEVVNRDRLLKLGMYVQLALSTAGSQSVVAIPAGAVQMLGDRTVVYVVDPNQQGRFVERQVALGSRSNDNVQVLSGLKPGEVIVAQGSFFVRAERERVNPSAAAAVAHAGHGGGASPPPTAGEAGITVQVTERGFEPDRVTVPRGDRAVVTFVRRTDNTCAKEVVIEAQRIHRELPLNQPVAVEIKTGTKGELAFACGMNMLKGAVVVQ